SPGGIPSSGAVTLLRNDSYTQGPKLFAKNCASCHRYDSHDGRGLLPVAIHIVHSNETASVIASAYAMTEQSLLALNQLTSAQLTNGQVLQVYSPATASDLKNFASRAWLAGLLDPGKITTTNYFGGTKARDGKMAKFVKKDVAGFAAEQKEQLRKVILAISAEAGLKSQLDADKKEGA